MREVALIMQSHPSDSYSRALLVVRGAVLAANMQANPATANVAFFTK